MESSIHSAPASTSRKRPRENETEAQRLKREKAAERQRRKRERDRNNTAAAAGLAIFHPQPPVLHHAPPPPTVAAAAAAAAPVPVPAQPGPLIDYRDPPEYTAQPDLTPDELARRDRVRAAARERQRKHRALVKQRKQREMGNDVPIDDLHYRVGPDGQYQPVLPHPHDIPQQHPHAPPPPPGLTEPPFPQQAPPGGQTFASTLLLSFSCAPLLKQHLLRTLHMTNEELASLEPILADVWEHWDRARRAHYAEQAAKAGLAPPNLGPSYPVELSPEQQQQVQQQAQQAAQYAAVAAAALPPPPPPPADAATNEFRARFHRPLVAPTPFRSYTAAEPGGSTPSSSGTATATEATTTTTGSAAIDPHLNGTANGTSKSESPTSNDEDFGADDPDFG